MKINKADILSQLDFTKQTVILHGCNCFHTMGAGIAKYLKQNYPLIYTVDKNTAYGDRNKLGTISIATIHNKLHIVNCYTQFYYGSKSKTPVDYVAIAKCLHRVALLYNGWEIRTPMIGCGLAGGDWDIVKLIFEETLGKQNLLIYYK